MKIAVTDASIFIDLLECEACDPFFRLPYQIVTSYQVWMELEEEQRAFLKKWVKKERLTVIKIEEDFIEITHKEDLSRSLSVADRSVWLISDREDGILVTSDGTLRKMAKKHRIETHGLLWVFDQMVREELLIPGDAAFRLQQIFDQNRYYRTNSKLIRAFESLRKKWKKFD